MRLLTRVEQLAKVTYESRQVKCVRYNVGTIGGEISGERTCKRRSAKHLEFLPSLLEGRRSIQLSYGRNSYVDSKSFIAKKSMILARLPSADRADAPCNCATCSSLATHLISTKVAKPIRQPIRPKSWSNLEQLERAERRNRRQK